MRGTWKPIAFGIVTLVVGLALVLLVARMAANPDSGVKVRLGADEFTVGQATTWADEIADNGPILFPDASPNKRRDVMVNHVGEDPLRGWYAFAAREDTSERSCTLQWRKASRDFEESCTKRVFPPDGTGLTQYPVRVTERNVVIVTLRTADGPPTTATAPSAPTAATTSG